MKKQKCFKNQHSFVILGECWKKTTASTVIWILFHVYDMNTFKGFKNHQFVVWFWGNVRERPQPHWLCSFKSSLNFNVLPSQSKSPRLLPKANSKNFLGPWRFFLVSVFSIISGSEFFFAEFDEKRCQLVNLTVGPE